MTLPDEPENYIHRIGRVGTWSGLLVRRRSSFVMLISRWPLFLSGRADRMGLAISLVSSAAKEKVWFHKCANRGKGCADTRVAPAGCTVWYDEPALLASVLRRLHIPLTEGLPSMLITREGRTASGQQVPYLFALPPSIAALGTVYGEERGERAGPSAHVELIRDQVQSLAALEVKAQTAFLAMKLRFGSGSAPSLGT